MILSNRVFIIFITTVLLTSVYCSKVFTQCNFTNAPVGDLCSSAIYICGDKLNGYRGKLRESISIAQPWVGMCNGNGSPDNMLWFSFTACSNKVTLEITVQTCYGYDIAQIKSLGPNINAGVQAGLYSKCDRSKWLDCSKNPTNPPGLTGTFTVSSDQFVPGSLGYFYLDGFSLNRDQISVCEFSIKVIEGIDTNPVTPPDQNTLANGQITGPNSITCYDTNTPLTFFLSEPERAVSFNNSCAPPFDFNPKDSICYSWNVSPTTGRYFANKDSSGTNTDIVFTQPGTYTISANTYFNPFYVGSCANAAAGEIISWTVTVNEPDTTQLPVIYICPGSTYLHQGMLISMDTTLYESTDPCNVKIHSFKVERNKENLIPTQFVCPGESFRFQGIDYYKGTFTVVDSADCLLVHKFEVADKPIKINDTGNNFICNGEKFIFQGKEYGFGTYEVIDSADCSLLHKFVVAQKPFVIADGGNKYICNGEKFIFQGKEYSYGTYDVIDSIDCSLLHKFVVAQKPFVIADGGNKYICNGEKFIFQGKEYGFGTYDVIDSTDCSLLHKFVVAQKPFVIADGGNKYICNGEKFTFQGKEYSFGTYDVIDLVDCSLMHKFVVAQRPTVIADGGTKYICGEEKFIFQGKEYRYGTFDVIDSSDCSLLHKFVVAEKPIIELNGGTKYVCSGDQYTFQGKKYNPGDYTINDSVRCDLIHKFKVENVNINLGVKLDTNVLNCNIKTINAVVLSNSNAPGPLEYIWKTTTNNIISKTTQTSINLPGTYNLTAAYETNGATCSSSVNFIINTDYSIPKITASVPSLRCIKLNEKYPDILVSSSIPLASSEWTLPLGQKASGFRTIADSINVVSGKPFLFTATGLNGCKTDTSFIVPYNFSKAAITLKGDIINCYRLKDTIHLTTNMIIDSVRWYKTLPSPAFYGSYPKDLFLEIDSPGTYRAEVMASSSKCWSGEEISISEDKKQPEVSLNDNIKWHCNTSSVEIEPQVTSVGDIIYSWSTIDGKISSNIKDKKLKAASIGIYSLNVLDVKNGCQKSGDINIIKDPEEPKDIQLDIKDISCFGEKNGELNISTVIGGYAPYFYTLNQKNVGIKNINLEKGDYTIEVKDKYDCTFKKSFTISEPPLFGVETPLEITIELSETANLTFSANYPDSEITSVIWKNSKGEIIGEDFDLQYSPILNETVELTVTTIKGCTASSRINIKVENEVKLFIPNIFSPNNDGINDKLTLFKNRIPITLNQYAIFDRYGNKVYYNSSNHFNENSEGWDGTMNGKPVESGVYILIIDYIDFLGNRQIFKKDITVMR